MDEKTENELRAEIAALEIKADTLLRVGHGLLSAFSDTLAAYLRTEPSHHDLFANFVTTFFAELKRVTGMDFDFDSDLERMGFDEVTTTVINQRIPVICEVLKMVRDGKSEKEIQDFVDGSGK